MRSQTVRTTLLAISLCSCMWAQKIATNPSQPTIPPVPGILENTLTAKKLTVGEKFEIRVIQQFSWPGFLGAAIGGATQQARGMPKEWGGGWAGFGQRYASSYGVGLTDQVFTFALETALHEDPRYFPSSERGFKRRFGNVLKQSLLAKKDDGHATFAYARVIGAYGSGFIANTWQPSSTNSAGDALIRGSLNLVGDASYFFVQEFLPFTRNSRFRRHARP